MESPKPHSQVLSPLPLLPKSAAKSYATKVNLCGAERKESSGTGLRLTQHRVHTSMLLFLHLYPAFGIKYLFNINN